MSDYNAKDLHILENLDFVRKRPGMYIGDTGKTGLHHLVWEIIDNSNDEVTNGFGNEITVSINKDGSISIEDNGRGMPIDIHPEKKINGVRVIFEIVGAGGKFNRDVYEKSGGLHGVGASVVNALSSFVEVEIKREGNKYYLKYENQKLVQDLKIISKKIKKTDTGTKVTFKPDISIFKEENDFDLNLIENRINELSYLNKNVKYTLIDKRVGFERIIQNKNGLLDYLKNIEKNPICDPIYLCGEKDDIKIECAFQYVIDTKSTILSYANNIKTIEGGTHETGVKTGLTKCLSDILKKYGTTKKQKEEINLTSNEVFTGLNVFINIKVPEPEFGGQTKTKLNNNYIKGIVHSIISEECFDFLSKNKNKTIRNKIIDRITEIYKIKEQLELEKENKNKKKDLLNKKKINADKVARCNSKNASECELFIVEGDSAGGSAKQGRNRLYQSILALRGKPLNVEKKSLNEILDSKELKLIVQEVGAGLGKDFDYKKSSYGKVIIMTDADVDGKHIQLILLTFFFRYMRDLIENDMLYCAKSPLYKVYKIVKGEEIYRYAYNDKDLEKYKKELGKNVLIQRFKGLGEMNSEQLWNTTMNPETRILEKITFDKIEECNDIINILMGENSEVKKEYVDDII